MHQIRKPYQRTLPWAKDKVTEIAPIASSSRLIEIPDDDDILMNDQYAHDKGNYHSCNMFAYQLILEYNHSSASHDKGADPDLKSISKSDKLLKYKSWVWYYSIYEK